MRIIAGKHKGKQLKTFDYDNIRPTSDRVRENIFNKIQFGVSDSYVLDLFGGTGAMSLEFTSRGANVITCDNNSNSVKLIKENFLSCNENANILECDYLVALKTLSKKKFDYIFLDPPYLSDYGDISIKKIILYDLLKKDGMIIYEHLVDKKVCESKELKLIDEKKYGTIMVSYLVKNND